MTAKNNLNKEEIRQLIDAILDYGNPSPPAIVNLIHSMGVEKIHIQYQLQMGLGDGRYHLDEDMHFTAKPPVRKYKVLKYR